MVSTPFRPNHFYDEQRLLLGKTYAAGSKVRLTASTSTVIDLTGDTPKLVRAGVGDLAPFGLDLASAA